MSYPQAFLYYLILLYRGLSSMDYPRMGLFLPVMNVSENSRNTFFSVLPPIQNVTWPGKNIPSSLTAAKQLLAKTYITSYSTPSLHVLYSNQNYSSCWCLSNFLWIVLIRTSDYLPLSPAKWKAFWPWRHTLPCTSRKITLSPFAWFPVAT